MTELGFCACNCGASLAGMRADAVYASEACEKRHKRAASTDKAPTRLLSSVASGGELAERFRPLIRTAIFDQLKTTGVCHADDLAGVYPEGHVDLCRQLATAHFGQLARRKLIQKTEWRKSTAPGRNGGGSWVWKFTKAGWDRYGGAGLSSDTEEGTAGKKGHGAGTLDRSDPGLSGIESSDASPSAAESGEDSTEGAPPKSTVSPDSVGSTRSSSEDGALELLPPVDRKAWAA